jgi:8-oxo-dGTP diphosphatase
MEKPKSPILMVDGLIIERGRVLLEKRNHYPFAGCWVLPGGHVDYGETVEKAVIRDMKEELDILVIIEKLFGVYSDPKRDPRYHTVSMVFLLKKVKGKIKIDRESSDFKFFSLKKLPRKIGFDHRQIINDFKKTRTR